MEIIIAIIIISLLVQHFAKGKEKECKVVEKKGRLEGMFSRMREDK